MVRELHTPEEVGRRLESLPEDIRNIIYSADMDSIIRQIGAKHTLHIDQMGVLEAEAVDVMIGFTKPNDFVTHVAEVLQIDQAKAGAVARDVNDMLFLKIRDSMKKVAELGSVSPISSTPVTPTPVSAPVTAPLLTPKPAEMHSADLMLTQKTASVTPVPQPTTDHKQQTTGNQQPPKPQNYKADPYREPVE